MEISIKELQQGLTVSHRKEDKLYKGYKIVTFDPQTKEFNEPLDVRFYDTASTTFCCIWGSIKGAYYNGSGKASGYGYDRSSAAFENALQSAGFEVKGLSGTGQNELAVERIAQLLGMEHYTIVSYYG